MSIDYRSPTLHSEISIVLKHMVTQSLAQIRTTPQVQMEEPALTKVGRRKAEITLSMEISISFQLPADCIIRKIDMDMVALSYQNFILPYMDGKVNLTHQFSFRERLGSWKIERMQRGNGTYDVFYCHSKSRTMFRYITEVVNFLQYGIYYDNQNNSKVKHILEDALTVKRKREPTFSNGRKRHEALSGKQANAFEPLRKMITPKGQDLRIAAEENPTELETSPRILYDMQKGEHIVELQPDGSLEKMLETLKNTKIDHQNDVMRSELPDFRDISSMDWAESDGLLDTYYDECELIYHIPICKSLDELVHFLIAKRNERKA